MLIIVINNAKHFAARQQCKLHFNGNTEHAVYCREAMSTPTTINKREIIYAFLRQQWLRQQCLRERATM